MAAKYVCEFCVEERLEFVTTVKAVVNPDGDTPADTLVFKCPSCGHAFQRERPDDWIDNGSNFGQRLAKAEGRSLTQESRPQLGLVREAISDILSADTTKVDETYVRLVAGRVALATMTANLSSKRPTVRQSAAKELMSYCFEKPTTRTDITTDGEKFDNVEDLKTAMAEKMERINALLAKAKK